MTWRNGYDYAVGRDAVDVLVDLAGRQPEPVEAALDVLKSLAEKLGVEVLVVPRSDAAITVAEIEAVAEVLVALGRRGLNDDEVAEDVQTALMIARDEIEEAIYEYEECPWRGDR